MAQALSCAFKGATAASKNRALAAIVPLRLSRTMGAFSTLLGLRRDALRSHAFQGFGRGIERRLNRCDKAPLRLLLAVLFVSLLGAHP